MNEVELIRAQLLAERTHAAEVAHACVAAIDAAQPADTAAVRAFRDACVSYLVWVLTRFEQRDQLLAERLQELSSPSADSHADTLPAGLAEVAGRPGTSREALLKLQSALEASPATARIAWQAFAHFFESAWSERRAAIEQQLTELPGVANWRAVCAVDADSILEERNRYARVAGQLPQGITLERPPGAAGA